MTMHGMFGQPPVAGLRMVRKVFTAYKNGNVAGGVAMPAVQWFVAPSDSKDWTPYYVEVIGGGGSQGNGAGGAGAVARGWVVGLAPGQRCRIDVSTAATTSTFSCQQKTFSATGGSGVSGGSASISPVGPDDEIFNGGSGVAVATCSYQLDVPSSSPYGSMSSGTAYGYGAGGVTGSPGAVIVTYWTTDANPHV